MVIQGRSRLAGPTVEDDHRPAAKRLMEGLRPIAGFVGDLDFNYLRHLNITSTGPPSSPVTFTCSAGLSKALSIKSLYDAGFGACVKILKLSAPAAIAALSCASSVARVKL